MGYQVLARKYRPQRFADVVGQDHVTVTLMNALTQQRIAHGYIFSGHRGIGKTTIARILAMALNCRNAIGSAERPTAEPCEVCASCTEIRAGNAVDVIEIDAATNRGIDEIRELRDAARYRPARDKYKIYILDEAHQITDAAFNALLKTLEEPPEHIVFMMATTQPEDIPQTVRSRCQHFSFHAVKLVDILGQLRSIAAQEGVEADESALALLAEAGDGSMRDALSIMDQAIASAPVSEGRAVLDASQIRELMGTVPNAVFERVLAAVDANQSAEVLTVANQLLDAGNSPAQLARQCVRYLRNCLVAKVAGVSADGAGLDGPAAELLQISPDEQRRAARTAALFSEEELTRFLQTMLRTFDELGYRQEQRFHFELGLLKLVHLRRLLPVEEVLSKFAGGAAGGGKTAAADAGGARSSAGSASVGVRAGVAPMQARASAATASAFVPLPPSLRPAAASARRETVAEPVAVAPVVAAMLPVVDPAAVVAPAPFAAAVPVVAMESAWQASGNAGGVAVFEAEEDSVAEVVFDLPASAVDEVEDVAAMLTDDAIGSATASTAAPASAAAGAGGVDAAGLQRAAVEALSSAASQGSASDALADAEWTVLNGEVRIQTELSKTMLPVVVNAEAEKILRAAVVERAPGLRVTLLPGAAKVAAAKKPRVARAGSAQAKAMEHPVVREAQRLFQAEIRNVIDLSDHE